MQKSIKYIINYTNEQYRHGVVKQYSFVKLAEELGGTPGSICQLYYKNWKPKNNVVNVKAKRGSQIVITVV